MESFRDAVRQPEVAAVQVGVVRFGVDVTRWNGRGSGFNLNFFGDLSATALRETSTPD